MYSFSAIAFLLDVSDPEDLFFIFSFYSRKKKKKERKGGTNNVCIFQKANMIKEWYVQTKRIYLFQNWKSDPHDI